MEEMTLAQKAIVLALLVFSTSAIAVLLSRLDRAMNGEAEESPAPAGQKEVR